MFRSQDNLQGTTPFLVKVTFLKALTNLVSVFKNVICWSDFKCFNVKNFYVCKLVGVN